MNKVYLDLSQSGHLWSLTNFDFHMCACCVYSSLGRKRRNIGIETAVLSLRGKLTMKNSRWTCESRRTETRLKTTMTVFLSRMERKSGIDYVLEKKGEWVMKSSKKWPWVAWEITKTKLTCWSMLLDGSSTLDGLWLSVGRGDEFSIVRRFE